MGREQSLLIHLQGYWGDARKQFPTSGEVVVLSKHSCEHHRELSAGKDTHFPGLCISQVGFRKRSQGRDYQTLASRVAELEYCKAHPSTLHETGAALGYHARADELNGRWQ